MYIHPVKDELLYIHSKKSQFCKKQKKILRMWFAVQQASDKEESDFVETRHQAKAIL